MKIAIVGTNGIPAQYGGYETLAENLTYNLNSDYDFIVSRAVTNMPDFVSWIKDKIKKQNKHELKNGILYLKGGDLTEELKSFPNATEYNIADFFKDEFFETKKVVHLPLKFKA